VIANNP